MAQIIDYWIQIEPKNWDVCPNNIDRMTGQTIQQLEGIIPGDVEVYSPTTAIGRTVKMYRQVKPSAADADSNPHMLILRRYTED